VPAAELVDTSHVARIHPNASTPTVVLTLVKTDRTDDLTP
jgi:hypothetical protein